MNAKVINLSRKIKGSSDELKSKMEVTKEKKISEIKKESMETIQCEQQRKNLQQKQYFRNVKDNLKRSNKTTRSQRWSGPKIYRTNTRKIYAQKFLKFSEIKLSIQTKQQILNQKNTKKTKLIVQIS